MTFDLSAEQANYVIDTTAVVAIKTFYVPQAPPNSTGEPDAKAVWVVDGSLLSANWPQTGPVDGLWSRAGDGGASGVIGSGSLGGTGIGVFGRGGGVGGAGTGVIGSGMDGVVGLASESTGIAVLGQNSEGSAIVGWAASPQQPTPIDEGSPGVTPTTMPAGVVAGVYGTIGDALAPSQSSARAGIWGDARNGQGNSADTGVLGTSQNGPGVSGSSGAGSGVSGFSVDGEAGVFESANFAQLRLVPSSTPIEDTQLLQTGQVGDLYLFSVAQEVGTSGTYDFNTILWLCVSPGWQHITGQAVWAPIQLGDTIGG